MIGSRALIGCGRRGSGWWRMDGGPCQGRGGQRAHPFVRRCGCDLGLGFGVGDGASLLASGRALGARLLA